MARLANLDALMFPVDERPVFASVGAARAGAAVAGTGDRASSDDFLVW